MIFAQDEMFDIVMRVVAFPTRGQHEYTEYAVLVYSSLPMPGLQPPGEFTRQVPAVYKDLRLQAVEHLNSVLLMDLLDDPKMTEKHSSDDLNTQDLSRRIRTYLSPGLLELFTTPAATLPVGEYRIWWDCESALLSTLPWELAFESAPDSRFHFVRGAPLENPRSIVPHYGPLRLAVIGQPKDSDWTETLWNPLQAQAGNDLEVKVFDTDSHEGSPGLALRQAISEGYELVHLVAAGRVSSSYDGILFLKGTNEQRMEGREFRSFVQSSRIAAIGFTRYGDTINQVPTGRSGSYRAFACLANVPETGPSMVTQLQWLGTSSPRMFWLAYYKELGASGDILRAIHAGRLAVHQQSNSNFASALFLKHKTGEVCHTIHDKARAAQEGEDYEVGSVKQIESQLDVQFFTEHADRLIKESVAQAESEGKNYDT